MIRLSKQRILAMNKIHSSKVYKIRNNIEAAERVKQHGAAKDWMLQFLPQENLGAECEQALMQNLSGLYEE